MRQEDRESTSNAPPPPISSGKRYFHLFIYLFFILLFHSWENDTWEAKVLSSFTLMIRKSIFCLTPHFFFLFSFEGNKDNTPSWPGPDWGQTAAWLSQWMGSYCLNRGTVKALYLLGRFPLTPRHHVSHATSIPSSRSKTSVDARNAGYLALCLQPTAKTDALLVNFLFFFKEGRRFQLGLRKWELTCSYFVKSQRPFSTTLSL